MIKTQSPVKKCRSCNAAIVFLESSTGRMVPVDYDKLPADFVPGECFNPKRHHTHFITCPDAKKLRRNNSK